MKILIVQDYLRSGGTERQSVLLANAFASNGHESTLLTFRPGGPLRSTLATNVHRAVLQPLDTTLDWFAPRLIGTLKAREPDVILCMGRMANCYAGKLQSAFPRTHVVATMRTGKPLPRLFRRSLVSVSHVIANSRDARSTLMDAYSVPAEKISVIYNSLVFPPAASSRADGLRTTHGATTTTTVLLCVAMFRPEKNQQELIEIVSELPPNLDWQLWLAGDGPSRADCERLAATKKCASRIVFTGFVQNPTELYSAGNIAVHASSSESLSNFLIEAQAHGLPAVAYRAQGIEETFVPGRTGWALPPSDRASFRQRIIEVATAPSEIRAARSTAARDFARNTFDSTAQVFRYLELFSRLISARNQKTRSQP